MKLRGRRCESVKSGHRCESDAAMVLCGFVSGVTMSKLNRGYAYAMVAGGADDIAGLERRNHARRSEQWPAAFSRAVLVRRSIAAQKSLGRKRFSGSTSLLETGLPCHPLVDFQFGCSPIAHFNLKLGPQTAHGELG